MTNHASFNHGQTDERMRSPASLTTHVGWSPVPSRDEWSQWQDRSLFAQGYLLAKRERNRLKGSSVSSNLYIIEIFSKEIGTIDLETSIKEIVPNEIYEYDMVIPSIPKKRHELELEITGIRKARHRIVEPDWI